MDGHAVSEAMDELRVQHGGVPIALDALLSRARACLRGAEILRRCAWGVTWIMMACAGAVVLDAAVAFESRGLLVLDLVTMAFIVSVMVWMVMGVRVPCDRRGLALKLEKNAKITGNPLINALDLSAGISLVASDDAGLSEALRCRAIEEGEAAAGGVKAGVIVDWRRLRKAGAVFALVMTAVILSALPMMRIYRAVLPRLADPWVDHPPYTRLTFEVRVEPEPVYYGKAASVRVRVGVPSMTGMPEEADVVFVEADGSRRRVPMMHAPAMVTTDNKTQKDNERHFVLLMEGAERSVSFYIDTPGGRSAMQRLDVLPVPLFERVEAVYVFPEYTRWPVGGESMDHGVVRVLADTHVTLSVTSNVPLREARMTLKSEKQEGAIEGGEQVEKAGATEPLILKPDAADARRVVGEFMVSRSSAYTIELVGADGTPGLVAQAGRVVCVQDAAPVVRFVEPDPVVLTPEGWPVRTRLEARDDIGLMGLSVYQGINGKTPGEVSLSLAGDRPRSAQATHELPVDAWGLRAGDVVRYYAVARDAKPVAGQSMDTKVQEVHVISMDEYIEMMRSELRIEDLEAEWEAMQAQVEALKAAREKLKEAIEQIEKQAEVMDEDGKQRMKEMAAQMREYEEQAGSLAEEMKRRAEREAVFDFEEDMKAAMRDLTQGLERQRDVAKQAREQMERAAGEGGSDEEARRAMRQFHEEDRPFEEQGQKNIEAVRQDMEGLRMAQDMMDAMEKMKGLIESQNDLATRMAAPRPDIRDEPAGQKQNDGAERERLERMAGEQEKLREEMEKTLDEMRHAAEAGRERLPKMSESVEQVIQKVEHAGAMDDQIDASQLARQGDQKGSAAAGRRAADKLSSLMQEPAAAMQEDMGELDQQLALVKPGAHRAMREMASRRAQALKTGVATGGQRMAGAARVSVVGPIPRQERGQRDDKREGEGDGAGRGGGMDDEQGAGVERMEDAASTRRGGGGAGLPGVPAVYRDAAEAYFKRLAEDADRRE